MPPDSPRTPDQDTTGSRLEAAALALLKENGILGGINLREVADRTGANRALVYYHFGNRRDLLRSALRRRGEELEARVRGRRVLPFVQRQVRQLRASSRGDGEYVRLLSLLVLDGDPDVRTIPLASWALGLLEGDRDRGELPPDTDLTALLALLTALDAGYALFRRRYARELGVGVSELDERVGAMLHRVLTALSE